MSPVLVAAGAALLVAGTVVVLTVWGRLRYARRMPSFRCRVGPPTARWRRKRARWQLRRTHASWVDDVLLLRSGVLRLWLTPLVVGVGPEVSVEVLEPGDVRGLGAHPLALAFTTADGGGLEIAVAHRDAGRLVGPFLTAGMSGLPRAPRERGV
jgi:hypothetical protein